MMIEFQILSGRLANRTFLVEALPQIAIGRLPGCELVLEEQGVSRRHCLIRMGPPATIEDLGSKNGTFVNGHRLDQPVLFTTTDVMTVGGARLRVIIPDMAASAASTQGDSSPATDSLERDLVSQSTKCACCETTLPTPVGYDPDIACLCSPCQLTQPTARKIGTYTLLRKLGEGATGTVFRTMEPDGRLVALKVFHSKVGADKRQLHRIGQETKLTSCLSHPNIVELLLSGADDDTIFLAYEHIWGGDLSGEIQRTGPLAPERVIAIGRQMTSALAHAHYLGVIHRDLKPANVLMSPDQEVKITDFGLAKAAGENLGMTGTGQTLGSPSYMPPEQKGSARNADERSDLYSLGATLYALTTGEAPFSGTMLQVFTALDSPEPVVPAIQRRPGTPPLLDLILRRALDKNPERRFASATELDHVLAQASRALGL